MLERVLRSPHLRWAAPLTAVAVAAGFGFWGGWPPALMVLALIALLLVIGLFWSSVQGLAGESPLTLEEALTLGAPSAEEEQKRALLRALNDLKYERSVGKISEEDYSELSQRYREQAKRLMQQLEGEQEPARKRAEQVLQRRLAKAGLVTETKKRKKSRAQPEAIAAAALETDAPRASTNGDAGPSDAETDSSPESAATNGNSDSAIAQHRRCPACDMKNDLDARFCKHCGKSLAEESEPVKEETS
jgi:hypothetical protein